MRWPAWLDWLLCAGTGIAALVIAFMVG